MPIEPGSELAYTQELYPDVAAVGAVYGDPGGKYAAFLKSKDGSYPAQPYFLWNQPFWDSGIGSSDQPATAQTSRNGGEPRRRRMRWTDIALAAAGLFVGIVFFG
jgi:hypothetical protein